MEIYVARQPIFNQHMTLYGYELLYRKSVNNYYEGIDGSIATSELVHNTFLIMDFNQLIDGTRGFINFSQSFLEKEIPEILPKEKVVIEIVEAVEATEAVINACKKLKSQGFTIALDDFIFNRPDNNYSALIGLADIIKVEFSKMDKSEQQKMIEKYKGKIIFLAEKVETREEFEKAIAMGYELFQGYFFSKPLMMKANGIGHLNIHLIRILEELQKKEPDFTFISNTIQKDLGLSFKLLRIANSIYYGGNHRIKDIRQALIRLGAKEITRWVSIMLIREFEVPETSELIKTCLLRGKLLSLMSSEMGMKENETDFFLTGILSSIDIILNDSKDKILDSLPIASEVKKALLEQKGVLYDLLSCVLFYENVELSEASLGLLKYDLSLEKLMELYFESLIWLDTTAR